MSFSKPSIPASPSRAWLVLLALAFALLVGFGATAEEPKATDTKAANGEAVTDEEPKIILYRTEWCGYCRKADKLLTDLGADFVSKDIEKDQEAAAEYQAKANGYRGIPLIDFDGEIVRGFREDTIRQQAQRVAQDEAAPE